MEPTIVIGAGPSGLSAAYHLDRPCLLLEAADRVGGLCRSVDDGGFIFDQAGHIMFTNDPYIKAMYVTLLGDNVHWQAREAWIYTMTDGGGVYTRYPFQASFYGLPVETVKDCLMGAIEAIHADGRAAATPRNFEEFIYRHWGAGIAKHFMVPYNTKLWAVPLSEMAYDWLGPRVPQPKLEDMIVGALQPQPKPMGPNAPFGYPLRGGFEALMRGFLPLLEAKRVEVRPRSRVTAVSPRRRTVTIDGREEVGYDRLVSSMPLPELIRAIGAEAPAAVRDAARRLRKVSVRCVNVGIDRAGVTDKHWIYYHQDTVFHRIFVQSNASPVLPAAGHDRADGRDHLFRAQAAAGGGAERARARRLQAGRHAARRRRGAGRQPGRHPLRLRRAGPRPAGGGQDDPRLAGGAGDLPLRALRRVGVLQLG